MKQQSIAFSITCLLLFWERNNSSWFRIKQRSLRQIGVNDTMLRHIRWVEGMYVPLLDRKVFFEKHGNSGVYVIAPAAYNDFPEISQLRAA